MSFKINMEDSENIQTAVCYCLKNVMAVKLMHLAVDFVVKILQEVHRGGEKTCLKNYAPYTLL